MAKVKPYDLTDQQRRTLLDSMVTLCACCRSPAELRRLLSGLLSEDEQVMLGRRIQVARLLLAEKRYLEIRGELGVGFDVITKVWRWIQRDPEFSLRLLERVRRQAVREGRREQQRHALPGSWQNLRRRYRSKFAALELAGEAGELLKSHRRLQRPARRR